MKTSFFGKKRGRKQKHFIASNGETILGLSKRSDGRWRIIGTNTAFTEPDEAKAIQRFRQLTGNDEQEREARAVSRIVRPTFGKREWQYVADQIRSRPQWVADQTGIEWIAYGPELRKPVPLPSLDELEKVWQQHARCSKEQMKKVLRCWRDFRTTTGIAGLKDLTPETVVEYSDDVNKRELSDKQKKHLYDGIRRLLRFARSRAIARDDLVKRLEHLELLRAESNGASDIDPRPIEIEDWKKMIAATKTPDEQAMLYLMLNGAFYIGEVVDLKWDDIKQGCIVAHREKTGKCIRVCVLWQETLDALSRIERKGEHIFFSYQGLPIKVSGAQRRWQQIALRAGLATARDVCYGGVNKQVVKCSVTASQLRDGAYTAAVESNVNESICRLLAGHRSPGVQDRYVRRNPKMVAPACEAVRRKYLLSFQELGRGAFGSPL